VKAPGTEVDLAPPPPAIRPRPLIPDAERRRRPGRRSQPQSLIAVLVRRRRWLPPIAAAARGRRWLPPIAAAVLVRPPSSRAGEISELRSTLINSARETVRVEPDLQGGAPMAEHRIFSLPFTKVYPMYVQKAERKQRTKEEVDRIICWLTGYDRAGLEKQIEQQNDLATFFAEAPALHPNSSLITGVVCGVRVEDVEDPLMQKIRYLDKLIDELAKGKAMEKILRK
jgi:hypothetical protein